jgi:PAS domain S-box-containing protein
MAPTGHPDETVTEAEPEAVKSSLGDTASDASALTRELRQTEPRQTEPRQTERRPAGLRKSGQSDGTHRDGAEQTPEVHVPSPRLGDDWAGSLLDHLYQYVALLDPAGNVREANHPLLSGSGGTREELIGRPFWESRFWQTSRQTNEQLRRAIRAAAGGRFVRYEAEVFGTGGGTKLVTIDFTIKPLRDQRGRVVRLLAEGRDITERKAAERQTKRESDAQQASYEKLKEFDRLRTHFFANVSHELRTPLTLILGPIRNRLERPDLDDAERRELQIVERNAGLLLKRVNNLLDLSKLEADEMSAQYEQTDLACLGRFVASHFESVAEERDIDFVVENPEILLGDADIEKVQRILLNLLSNAFKFTPDGGTIAFTLHEDGGKAVYVVQDSGVGICPKMRERIFERFRQVDHGAHSTLGGTGLGLSIVKEFVALHGGRVSVGESPGGGAAFTVELPLAAPEGVPVARPNEPRGRCEEAGRQTIDELRTYRRPRSRRLPHTRADAPLVLVVEDNPDMNAYLAETVGSEFRVATAYDGEEGLQKALQLRPDLILTDMLMPRMSGEELVRELRQQPQTEHTPIVLLTARIDDQMHVKLLNEGVMSYLDKPFTACELLTKVRRLINEHRRSQATLRQAYGLLHAVTEGINDAVFVKDRRGRYLMINSAGARSVNRSKEEMLGKDDGEFFSPETAAQILKDDMTVMATGEGRTYEQKATANGVTRYYLATRLPYRDDDGRVVGVMGISRDITPQKGVERELREAKEAAEAANKAKDRFLAILSHELRTPLTPVLATVNYMETRGDLPPDLRREMTMIRRNVEMEARLIDDLLDLTRISRGKIELHYEAVDAHAALRRALEICQSDIEARQLEVSQGLWAKGHYIWADPARIQQVFWNLINNAVKFTPAGGKITLRTKNVRERELAGVNPADSGLPTGEVVEKLVVEVSDSGVGIEPEVLPRIFSAFEQGERTVTRKFGGLGLGLAISKALARMHQATLTAHSDGPGQGATFAMTAATIKAEHATEAKRPAAKDRIPPAEVHILLVEDHEDTLRMMTQLLRMFGYTVSAVSSVQDARDLAEREQFDLVISDIGLPDGSGLDVIRHLRAAQGARTQGARSARPIRGIALSGFGMEEDLRKSRDAGFERHLTKPVSLEKLEDTIHEVLADEPPAE